MRDLEVTRSIREPQVNPGTPTSQDISELLAAICKIEKLDQSQTPSQREEFGHPVNAPTPQSPRRLAEVLDSLASLAVSQSQHEVVATSIRVDDRKKTLELIAASNTNVSPATSKHLRDMWEFMVRLSNRFYELDPDAIQKDTPSSRPDDPFFQGVYHQFAQVCFEFSFKRIQKKINGKFGKLRAIDIAGLGPEHPFRKVRQIITFIMATYTSERNPLCGKPRREDHHAWKEFHVCLREAKHRIKEFLDGGGFQRQGDTSRVLTFVNLDTYLRKIASFSNSFEILVRASLSPRSRRLFAYQFKLAPLPEVVTKLPKIAHTAREWEKILDMAVSYHNSNRLGVPRALDPGVIDHHTTDMAKEAITRSVCVHCEVKLLTSIHKTQTMQPNLPKAYSYIGVSKLSCNGCDSFIKAFNRENGANWITKGCHGKSYYPWMFPQPFPSHVPVLLSTYSDIVVRWVNSYRGYAVPSVSLKPDSADQSSRSGDGVPDMDSEEARNYRLRLFKEAERIDASLDEN